MPKSKDMKITISLLVLFCLLTGREMQAQVVDITGTWTMFEMTWTSGEEVNKTTEDQLKDEGMTSEYSFMSDGKLKLISNMTGSGSLETVEGTWKLEGEELTCSLSMDGNSVDIIWGFEFKDEVIHLTRTSPDGSTSVVNSFKRK
jgi:hypothetical protein